MCDKFNLRVIILRPNLETVMIGSGSLAIWLLFDNKHYEPLVANYDPAASDARKRHTQSVQACYRLKLNDSSVRNWKLAGGGADSVVSGNSFESLRPPSSIHTLRPPSSFHTLRSAPSAKGVGPKRGASTVANAPVGLPAAKRQRANLLQPSDYAMGPMGKPRLEKSNSFEKLSEQGKLTLASLHNAAAAYQFSCSRGKSERAARLAEAARQYKWMCAPVAVPGTNNCWKCNKCNRKHKGRFNQGFGPHTADCGVFNGTITHREKQAVMLKLGPRI
jgi:hypothetical protein